MAFNALTYRVLIASPSDLGEERAAAAAAVNEWSPHYFSGDVADLASR